MKITAIRFDTVEAITRRQALKNLLYGIALASCPILPNPASASFPTRNRTGKLSFVGADTGEKIENVSYVDDSGRFDPVALEELNFFFRCKYDDKVYPIDPGLFYWLDILKNRCGYPNARFRLFSGYRSPQYNRILRKRGFGAAKNSFHLQGRAADVSLERVPLKTLAMKAVWLQFGGVSRYRRFIHLDVGRNRTW